VRDTTEKKEDLKQEGKLEEILETTEEDAQLDSDNSTFSLEQNSE
jgi:hypothetical protein